MSNNDNSCNEIEHADQQQDIEAWLAYAHDPLASQTNLKMTHDQLKAAVEHLRPCCSDSSSQLRLVRAALGWCRAAGRLECFDSVIAAADEILSRMHQHAVASGYKGYALMKLQRHSEAILCLEEAQHLFQAHPPRDDKPLARQVQRVVDDAILTCCRVLGRDPPLPPLIKFPRTSHLFRSKAVTEDDEVLSKDHAMLQQMNDGVTVITMEEKVDGANLGICITADGGSLLVQNRSHYISTSGGEHAQFGPIQAFLEEHREALMRILKSDGAEDDERKILFGEWLVARHSIPYGQLPGYFVAFDLLHVNNGRFVSRAKLHEVLQGSGIPVVPVLGTRTFGPHNNVQKLETELWHLLETTQSHFRTDGGPIEGIVFRVDDEGWLSQRSKLVRPDFVAGCTDGHWSRRAIEKQRVDWEFAACYMNDCYSKAAAIGSRLPEKVPNPRQRVVVTYPHGGRDETPLLTTVNGNAKVGEDQVLLPRNLCWLWPEEVAVSSTPTAGEQIKAFEDVLNIGLVLTLTEEQPLPMEWFQSSAPQVCCNVLYAIPNGYSPTLQQMDDIGDEIVRTIVTGKAVLEHCGGGKGRAGTVATCLLLRFGLGGVRRRLEEENNSEDGIKNGCRSLLSRRPFLTSDAAIREIRQRRPGSLETVQQEEFVHQYAQHLWRLANEEEAILSQIESSYESEIPTLIEAKPLARPSKLALPKNLPRYVLLVGIPGSGKSTIGRCISRCSRRKWIHVNRDELGRHACKDLVGQESARVAQGKVGGIIVDCCSVRVRDRREWLQIMHQPTPQEVALVFVDIPVDACIARVRSRVDHPSIPFGRGERIVRGFAERLEAPTNQERQLFGRVEVLRTRQDVRTLLHKWGVTTMD